MEASFAPLAWPSLLPTFFSFWTSPLLFLCLPAPNQTSCIMLQPYLGVVHFPCPISANRHKNSLLCWSYRVIGVRHHLHYLHKVSHHVCQSIVSSGSMGWSRRQKAWYSDLGRISPHGLKLHRNIENKHLSPLLGSPMR